MSVQAKKRAKGLMYYAVFYTADGTQVWERAGTDKREAERLDARRQKEVKAGTYEPKGKTLTVAAWSKLWLASVIGKRSHTAYSNRMANVLTFPWFATMKLPDVRPRHAAQLAKELKLKISDVTGKTLSPKTVHGIFAAAHTCFQAAVFQEHIDSNPMIVPAGTLSRLGEARVPYEAAEVQLLTTDKRVAADTRVWAALAFYTGARMGELCGLKWSDLIDGLHPLLALQISKQYEGQPLKTDDTEGTHARAVPVHPVLLAALTDWWAVGFDAYYGRAPTLEDYIVPRADFTGITRHIAQHRWDKACAATNVPNRTVHSTRHTFVSFMRRCGAREELVEVVTHNSKGRAIIDVYTAWDWPSVCSAVECLKYEIIRQGIDGLTIVPSFFAAGRGRVSPESRHDNGTDGITASEPPKSDPSHSPEDSTLPALSGANQQCPQCGHTWRRT